MPDEERAVVDVRLHVSGATQDDVRAAIEKTMRLLRADAPPAVRVSHFRLRSPRWSPSWAPTMWPGRMQGWR